MREENSEKYFMPLEGMTTVSLCVSVLILPISGHLTNYQTFLTITYETMSNFQKLNISLAKECFISITNIKDENAAFSIQRCETWHKKNFLKMLC